MTQDLWRLAADLLDPPAWQPSDDRPPLLPHQHPPDGDWHLWILAGGRGCIAAGTLIYDPTRDEHVPVEEWGPCRYVQTINGPAPSTQAFLKGKADLYQVATADGHRVTVTDAHRFLTPDGWMPLAALIVGYEILSGVPKASPSSAPHSMRTLEDSRVSCSEDHHRCDPIRWTRIVAIDQCGEGEYWDLTVPGEHHYLANGLWHHNSGKTEGACREFLRRVHAQKLRARIIGPTLGDVVESCVEGDSGIIAMDPTARFLPSAAGGALVTWPNGSRARLIGTPTPRDVERLRAAGNVHLDWWEELAANPQLEKAWAQAQFGNRLGQHPLAIASTTPRVRKFLKTLLSRRTTSVTHARMDDNPHLTDEFRDTIREMYEGTRIGRQEIEGELLEDIEGALWLLRMIDVAREQWELAVSDYGGQAPRWRRVVVGVDPNASETGAECGIVVCAAHPDGKRAAVLDDQSVGSASPDMWARAAVQAYWDWEADCIAAEVNQGGDMVAHTIRTVDPRVRVKQVRATRGKTLRAEPVVALYEQGRVMHRHRMPILEDQMTTWTPDQLSPDRLDALVWGLTEVMGLSARKSAPMRAY